MPENLREHLRRHLELAAKLEPLVEPVERAAAAIANSFANGGHLYTFGNGGSACDANHFAEDLTGRYRRERRPLPAMALTTDGAGITCIGNDYDFKEVFARPLQALVRRGDVAFGLTTSGTSENVVRGLRAARERGAVTIALTGAHFGPAAEAADHPLLIPSTETARVQEMSILLIHLICERLDEYALGEAADR